MNSTLSVVVSAYNEERNLERCLSSVRFADEIIVINNSSVDATEKIAKKYTKKVYTQPNRAMLNTNKNYGMKKATCDWILYLDADEVVPDDLRHEIETVIRQSNSQTVMNGYWIPRKNILFGRWIRHGIWWPDPQLRMIRRGKGTFPCKHVHEKMDVEGATDSLTQPFLHYNYESISQYLYKFSAIYTDNEVDNLIASGYVFDWKDAIRFPLSDFLKIYFAQESYKDGLHGLILALLQAFYSFVTFAKLWERKGFVDIDMPAEDVEMELSKSGKDVLYWIYETKIKSTGQSYRKILFKIYRKIRSYP